MSPKKLSDSDKQEIIQLYRTSSETTSTLAQRYGVSSSTVSRFLKNYFSEVEYESLIQKKRLIARTIISDDNPELIQTPLAKEATQPILVDESEDLPLEFAAIETYSDFSASTETKDFTEEDTLEYFVAENEAQEQELANVITLNEMLGEDLEVLEDEDDYLEEDDWEEPISEVETHVFAHHHNVEVLPLSEAYFPKVCYVVIDRFAELITRPLQEFAELGKIPVTEVQQKTLPIFDNQRVARRFSNRSQRVIKVPDGRLFKKTSTYLKAKGITRLLIDGQVYAC